MKLCDCGKPVKRLMRGRIGATCSAKCSRRRYYVMIEKTDLNQRRNGSQTLRSRDDE